VHEQGCVPCALAIAQLQHHDRCAHRVRTPCMLCCMSPLTPEVCVPQGMGPLHSVVEETLGYGLMSVHAPEPEHSMHGCLPVRLGLLTGTPCHQKLLPLAPIHSSPKHMEQSWQAAYAAGVVLKLQDRPLIVAARFAFVSANPLPGMPGWALAPLKLHRSETHFQSPQPCRQTMPSSSLACAGVFCDLEITTAL